MSACWPLQGMSPAQKAVLISLADQASDDGVCWPGVGTIARRTCLSERAVQEAIAWLQAVGLVFRHYRSGASTSYTVMPSSYRPESAPQPRQRTKKEATPADGAPGADGAPPQMAHPGGANGAPPPPQMAHPGGAPGAPKSSLNRNLNHQGTVIVGAQAHNLPPPPVRRASGLPADFSPDATAQQLAQSFGLNLPEQLAAFVDHHTAKGSVFKDWQAALRNWLRNGRRFGQQQVRPGAGGPVNRQTALEARNRAVGEAWEARMRAQMQQQGGSHAG